MKPTFKSKIRFLVNYTHTLSIIYLAVFILLIIFKGLNQGFNNLEIRVNKLPFIIGVPIVVLIATKLLSKKLEDAK